MGGVVPLGYRVAERALHIVEEHAALVRTIFSLYVQLGAVTHLQRHLSQAGMHVPERIDGTGRRTGGKPFSRGHLYAMLANPIYVGRLTHKGRVHEGQHPAILDLLTFETVGARLAANHHEQRRQQASSESLLTGRIRDDRGTTMTPSHAQKGPRRYRYYVSQSVLQGREPGSITRVSAPEIEALVVKAIRGTIPASRQPTSDAELVAANLIMVSIHPDRLTIEIIGRDDPIELPWSHHRNTRRREIFVPQTSAPTLRPMKGEDRARILTAIATARDWLDGLISGRIKTTETIATRENCSERSVRMTLSLAHLSPAIVRAIVDGRLPRGIGIRHLADLPASWAEQHRAIGL